ncbi:oxidoreductase, putative [Eimeria necatrix]|uniref:Oxidoreductase, putative n=1 Tax=Eimeria necatrix TaxID=51315 RepID=U6MG80_9EIME|nr:oxidoreductase, putative [Eimeria necatrix]CDJ62053.1 oxidoreductase, putative [Eimeria necatrix]
MAGTSSCSVPWWARIEGVVCMTFALLLFPALAYIVGVFGIIIVYCVTLGCIALLYAAQVFLNRSANTSNPHEGRTSAPYSIKGRHVLITGGSKGIGHAIAIEAVQKQAKIITLVARDAETLREAQTKCLEEADKLGTAVVVQTVPADLVNSTAAIECLDIAASMKGNLKTSAACSSLKETQEDAPIEVFFCNAADVDPRPFCAMGTSNISRCVAMNMCTPFLQVKHLLPSMIQRRFGAICFTNSLTTFVPIYGFSTYSATKAALKAFAEVINQEVAGMGILVANAFLPSVNTPGYQREKQVRHRLTEILEETSKIKQPEEVAERLVAHLEAGHRIITVDFEGWVCARLNAGFSRAESLASLFYEFLLSGIFRIVSLALFLQFFSIITREQPATLRRSKIA